MQAEDLWLKFIEEKEIKDTAYEAWAFGEAPDVLLELVLIGRKTATASAFQLYEIESEDLPTVSAYSVILDSKDEAACIIRTTKVTLVPFNEVVHLTPLRKAKTTELWSHGALCTDCFFQKSLKNTSLNSPKKCLLSVKNSN